MLTARYTPLSHQVSIDPVDEPVWKSPRSGMLTSLTRSHLTGDEWIHSGDFTSRSLRNTSCNPGSLILWDNRRYIEG